MAVPDAAFPALTEARRRIAISEAIEGALQHAYEKHGTEPWGRHEFYGVLREEVDELWDAIKGDEPTEHLLAEAVQIACVCIRYMETGDRHRGPHPLTAFAVTSPA